MKGIVCKVCGFISLQDSAPENCPVCHAPKTAFLEKEDAIKTAQNPAILAETEKKHIPVIVIEKKCSLIPEGCTDVHVKIGEINHPMEKAHFIGRIDFYLEKEFLSRIILTPENLNAAGALHLRKSTGKIQVVEWCNVHGAWFSETSV